MNGLGNFFTFLTCVSSFALLVSLLVKHFLTVRNTAGNNTTKLYCWKNFKEDKLFCRPYCENGSFSLSAMTYCRPWLGCKDIEEEVKVKYLLVEGIVKKVYLAEWNGYDVVMAILTTPSFETDFKHHVQMLNVFGSNSLIVQMLGYCNNTVITEYHRLGSALNIDFLLKQELFKYNTASTRLQLCISYVEILAYLHNSSAGTRVMCDSNSLEKTLSQYLLRDDLHLVLNDLDALPEINRSQGRGIRCGHKQLTGAFVAPEQLWPYQDRTFCEEDMPYYNEKSDIWKIPDVCNWFLGHVPDSDVVKFKLFKMHKQCKEQSPFKRPTAKSVEKFYISVWKEMFEEK